MVSTMFGATVHVAGAWRFTPYIHVKGVDGTIRTILAHGFYAVDGSS